MPQASSLILVAKKRGGTRRARCGRVIPYLWPLDGKRASMMDGGHSCAQKVDKCEQYRVRRTLTGKQAETFLGGRSSSNSHSGTELLGSTSPMIAGMAAPSRQPAANNPHDRFCTVPVPYVPNFPGKERGGASSSACTSHHLHHSLCAAARRARACLTFGAVPRSSSRAQNGAHTGIYAACRQQRCSIGP